MKGKSKADTSKKADNKLGVKKKGSEKASSKPAKKAKLGKDPNKPKRPPSAFFVFMEGFREQYKKNHPNVKLVSVIGKAGGAKWKSMSDAEKTQYMTKANKLMAEYEKKIASYNKQETGLASNKEDDDEGSDKSEVNEEEGSEEEEEEDDE